MPPKRESPVGISVLSCGRGLSLPRASSHAYYGAAVAKPDCETDFVTRGELFASRLGHSAQWLQFPAPL